jgi:glycosyltransferase involved in cell wall biosynthesis
MKLVRSRDPAIECLLVGSDMPASLRRLAAGGPQQPTGVIALGAVADLSAVLGRVRLAVAPLRVGTGFRDAMLDSMAAGVPCVCTRLAVEGMALEAQRWPEALRVPDDTAESIAAVIARWHGDPHEHRRAVQAGIAYIRRELGEHCIDAALAAALGQEARLLQSA